MKLSVWCLTAALLICSVVAVKADSTNLTPVADTYLLSSSADANFGFDGGIKLGTTGTTGGSAIQRGLLMFDVASALPAGSVVQSVQLRVTVIQAPGSGIVPNFGLFPVQVAWAESEATWNNRLLSDGWADPGGLSGSDYSSSASASIPLMGVGDYSYGSTAALVSDVQSWVDNAASNHGWMIISDQEGTSFTARKIGSRSSGSPPMLQIDFLGPPHIDAITLAGETVQIEFTAESPYAYDVQYTESLNPTAWQTLTNITAKLETFDALASDSITNGPQRFYRVSRSGPIR